MKKEITFVDSWLTKVSKEVKKYEKYTYRGWSTIQKYEDLVEQKIIKPIKK